MGDVGLLQILTWPALPLWIVALALFVMLARAWPAIMERVNEARRDRATIAANDYGRMDARLQRLEAAEEECRKELNEALRRLAEVEGYMTGQGHARQEAANIVAIERLSDKAKDGDK